MTTGRKFSTIICGNKGGVGKSLIATIKTLVYQKNGCPLQVVEIDHQQRLSSLVGPGSVSKSIPANVSIEDISRDRHAAEKFYNAVYREWMQGNSLTDLGANVTTPLLSWIENSKIMLLAAEDQIEFRVVAVTSPDDEALRSAHSAIVRAMEVFGAGAEMYVVLNDNMGSYGFRPYAANESYKAIEQLEKEGKLSILRVPFCDSILFELARGQGINARDAVDRWSEIAEAGDLDMITARSHRLKLVDWLRSTQSALAPILRPDDAVAA